MKSRYLLLSIAFIFSACRDGDDDPKETCKNYQEPLIQCVCTKEYNPVCGCNGKTYGNPCLAECLQVPSYEMGECN